MSVIWLDQLVIDWVDRHGNEWTTPYTLADQSGFDASPFGAFLDALQAASRAGIARVRLSRVATRAGSTSAGPYDTVKDHALLQAVSGTPRAIRLRIPAPMENYITGGDELVDVSHALIVAVQDEASAVIADLSGEPLVEIKRGRRVLEA